MKKNAQWIAVLVLWMGALAMPSRARVDALSFPQCAASPATAGGVALAMLGSPSEWRYWRKPTAGDTALAMLVALALGTLIVVCFLAWLVLDFARDRNQRRKAIPVFAFCVAGISGVLGIADSLGIMQLTHEPSDRKWFVFITVLFGLVGSLTQRAYYRKSQY
ncbi:MAG: hypothetical protein WAM82_04925 [Thermoanaerobaculia bacterium]